MDPDSKKMPLERTFVGTQDNLERNKRISVVMNFRMTELFEVNLIT